MAKKDKGCDFDKKGRPTETNDQLGENAGEGRFERAVESKNKKCK